MPYNTTLVIVLYIIKIRLCYPQN